MPKQILLCVLCFAFLTCFTSCDADDRRRAELHELMLKGEMGHDGSLELNTIGDMSSVPALLVVLKDNPPAANGTVKCTTAHALTALRRITGANPGITYEAWDEWWKKYEEEHKDIGSR